MLMLQMQVIKSPFGLNNSSKKPKKKTGNI